MFLFFPPELFNLRINNSFYGSELRNQKTYDPDKVATAEMRQVKHDSNGDFIWETVPTYTVDDKVPYGHGEKSVMMIEEYIKLKPVERYAIRWHMGFTEPKENWNTLKEAIKKYPLVLAMIEAGRPGGNLYHRGIQ